MTSTRPPSRGARRALEVVPMPRLHYTERARRRFVANSESAVPWELVERGERSLQTWLTVLNEERQRELQRLRGRLRVRPR